MGQIHVRVPGLLNKLAKKNTKHPPLPWLFSQQFSWFCLFQFFSTERVSKPQHKHADPLTGKGQNKLWPCLSPALEPACYVTVDMLSCSMRRMLVPRMNTRQFGTVKLMVSQFIRRLLDVNAKYQQGVTARGQGQKNKKQIRSGCTAPVI